MKSHLIVAVLGLSAAVPALADDAASATSNTSTSNTSASAPKVICLQNSIRCFTARNPTKLDLRAPALTRVFSQAELEQKLPETAEVHETEIVQVQGERQITPVSVGLMAIPWAIIHPTQAWRILMPLQEAK